MKLYKKSVQELQDILVELSMQLEGCTPAEARIYIEKNYTNKEQLIDEIDWTLELLEK